MDTGTHLVVGIGLAGLAYLDPAVASDTAAAAAVLTGTVLGSQAPDTDGLYRLRSNAAYVRNHRGFSHSIPAVFGWTALITALLAILFPDVSAAVTAKWVLLAVVIHVLSDMFNTYGTQSLRPFSRMWVSWNVIHIFDPFIFTAHAAAILLWVVGAASPGPLFAVLYIAIVLYYGWRTAVHWRLERQLPIQDPRYKTGDSYSLLPTVHAQNWNIVKRNAAGGFRIGELRNGAARWTEEFHDESLHPAAAAASREADVQAFLSFTSFAYAEVKEHSWGYEVKWADVRYQHRKQYPFVAVVLLDHEMKTLDSYVGWLNEAKLEKRLKLSSL